MSLSSERCRILSFALILTCFIAPVLAAACFELKRFNTSLFVPAITDGADSARSTDSASPIVTSAQLVFLPSAMRWRIVAWTKDPKALKISSSASSFS